MTENWYWEHGRQLLGPLDTSTLEDLVRHHRVFDRDRVRLAASDEWMTGAVVKQMFAGQRREGSAEVASRLIEQQEIRRLKLETEPHTAPAVASGQRHWRRACRCGDRWLGFIADGVTGIGLAVVLVARSRIVRTIVAAAVVVVVFGWIYLRSQESQRVYSQLLAAAQTVREMQALPPPQFEPQEWRRLQSETRAWLTPTLRSLENAAAQPSVGTSSWFESRSTTAARRYLIQAARDLDCMLSTVPAQSGCSLHFIVAMEKAQRELNAPDVPMDLPDSSGRMAAAVHQFTMPVIAADILLLAGGLYYWIRRRAMSSHREAT